MTQAQDPSVTQLLRRARDGDTGALHELIPLVQGELHALASQWMRKQPGHHTLQSTALVNEAYLKLFGGGSPEWQDRTHFFRYASTAMRTILVDHARRKRTTKSPPQESRVPLDDLVEQLEQEVPDLASLDEELKTFTSIDPTAAKIVELRFFSRYMEEEIAGILEVSLRTVQRKWTLARAWLRRELGQ
jgi:RNA polymerase sigma factor (TIGR02999 family)